MLTKIRKVSPALIEVWEQYPSIHGHRHFVVGSTRVFVSIHSRVPGFSFSRRMTVRCEGASAGAEEISAAALDPHARRKSRREERRGDMAGQPLNARSALNFDHGIRRHFAALMLTFRKAEEPDIPTLRSLAQCIWRACYPAIIGSAQVEYMLEMMYSEETIRREIAEGVHWELAFTGGEPAGFISITAAERGPAKLNKLYLKPELHGRGLGQQLIVRACEAAARLGAGGLSLQVNKRNERAIQAYRRAGFRIEKEAVFDIGSGYVMDDFIMSRAVP